MRDIEKAVTIFANGGTFKEASEQTGFTEEYIRRVCKRRGLYTVRFHNDKERREKCLQMIKDGITAKEIASELEYANPSAVYNLAKQYGLKTAKKKPKVKPKYIPQMETRICPECGKEFTAEKNRTKIFCSTRCQKLDSYRRNGRTDIPREGIDDSKIAGKIEKNHPDFEYVGGYTGSEGYMMLKHKVCGHIQRVSSATIRHKHKSIRCNYCTSQERQERQERKTETDRVERMFIKHAPKRKLIKVRECPICGTLFVGETGRDKYCSDECKSKADQSRRETRRHYESMKKRRRKNSAWTAESKTISLKKLYERDNGVCWLCGGRCNYSKDSNDPDYPTIDHVIPIAKGGKDTWENIRLAHRRCNSLKSDRIVRNVYLPICLSQG